MTQHEIRRPTVLLDPDGNLAEPGYATRMLYQYNPGCIHANPFALKEWDFYQIMLGEYILQLTIGHVSYMANFSANLFSLRTGDRESFSVMQPLPLRSLRMPLRPDDAYRRSYHGKGWQMRFDIGPDKRKLILQADGRHPADIDITLHSIPTDERMVIATPFDKPGQFYLNCKENYYRVEGFASVGSLSAAPSPVSTALLDWGRGVWPFHQEWFWGNGAANLPQGRFGFNIGWGFGDLSYATENMFFLNGRAQKLGRLTVTRDEYDYMAPWHFVDEDGRFDFTMTPVYDNDTRTKVLFVNNRCHQIFGLYTGQAVTDDGQVISVTDMPAFCEHAVNNW